MQQAKQRTDCKLFHLDYEVNRIRVFSICKHHDL